MRLVDLVILLAVGALWGASFLFMRQAAPVLGPVGTIEARVLLAGLALLAIAVMVRKVPDFRRDLSGFLILGVLMAAAPFTLIAAAELKITASLAAILNATTPLFALLVSAVWQHKRPHRRQLAGVALGLAGVAALVGLGPLEVDGTLLLAVAASLLAALFYALGGVYAKVRFPDTPPLVTATGQQLGAAVCLLIPALAMPPRESVSGTVVLSVVALALGCTALGFVLFFRLVNSLGPTGALTVTFLVPLFGVLWGTVFLSEPLTWSMPVGMAMVLGAVFFVTERRPSAAPARTAQASTVADGSAAG
ncbi:DMT family transporter [Yinghuangia seranimata]|uniref:DMT family transporter n=1 Tax=Yinghuangia seranimata TaxID=408067 RepID=UPI00248C5084|nr:DMT family transporter [Yinghuangia seranimata]MDI2132428.1 DMT family transporter [Yinghuangia seranimata]